MPESMLEKEIEVFSDKYNIQRVFAFQDMFYECIANGAKKEYRAAKM